VVEYTGDGANPAPSPVLSLEGDAYFKYASDTSGGKKVETPPTLVAEEPQKEEGMAALRSKPFQVSPIKNRSGTTSFRVTGTIKGKQLQQSFQLREDADAQQLIWETERIAGARAARPRISTLSDSELKEAEALFHVAKRLGVSPLDTVNFVAQIGKEKIEDVRKAIALANGEAFTLTDAVKAAVRTNLAPGIHKITFEGAFEVYLAARVDHVSRAHYDSIRQRIRSFGSHVGLQTLVCDIADAQALAWLKKKTNDGQADRPPSWKKTWNNLLGDVSAFFVFCGERRWVQNNPFASVAKFSKKALGAASRGRDRLEVQQCTALMSYVEKNHPKWCCYFAVALFAGVRPDLRNGEMWELARCIRRDGPDKYYNNGQLHLTAEITKEGEPRDTTVSENLAVWLKKYPLTPENICPGDYSDDDYRQIRTMFSIPHDGLRHTAISAFMSRGRDYAAAADEFGNSEPIIRKHYLKRMSPGDAERFYAILPK
jgi:hypothetical protein